MIYNIIIPGIPNMPTTPAVNPFIPMAIPGTIKLVIQIIPSPVTTLITMVKSCFLQILQMSIITQTTIRPIMTCWEFTSPIISSTSPSYYVYAATDRIIPNNGRKGVAYEPLIGHTLTMGLKALIFSN